MSLNVVAGLLLFILQMISPNDRLAKLYFHFAQNIEGKWRAPAWSGQLHETWYVDPDNWLTQQAVYFEKTDTTYRAQSRIGIVSNKLILYTVIENANPKIFQATIVTSDSVVFENSDYKNPSKVVYRFIDINTFHRTISGLEKDHAVSYTFNFTRENH